MELLDIENEKARSSSVSGSAVLSEVNRLRARRTAYAGHLTRLINEINEAGSLSQEKISVLRSKFSSIVSEITELCTTILDKAEDDTAINNEVNYKVAFISRVADAENTLSGLSSEVERERSSCSSSSGYHHQVESSLPKKKLPVFSGEVIEWRSFWDRFSSAVDRRDIPAVDKLDHLMSCLKGPAKDCVRGIQVTPSNYQVVLKILKKNYGDPSRLVGLYSEAIVDLPVVGERDLKGLRSLLRDFEGNLRVLKQLLEEITGVSNAGEVKVTQQCEDKEDGGSATSATISP